VIHKSAIDKKGGVKGARRDVEPCLGGSWIEIDARDGSEIDVEGAGEAGESLDSATAASDACGCLGSIRGTTYESVWLELNLMAVYWTLLELERLP
ncbi:unnamed protein product, partial [Ilex paraguariensis]